MSTKKIKIHVKPVHPQSGPDCGVYAIASMAKPFLCAKEMIQVSSFLMKRNTASPLELFPDQTDE